MLSQITISNYTIVKALEMDFTQGLTVITGETGAGKSIMLDALGLCLGDRADPKAVRPGCERAEITAAFDLTHSTGAQQWLQERDLTAGDELLLRRVITTEGRSRAYINGTPATLQDCAELGALLIDIHSQHSHQSLLRKAVQRELLDAYAGHLALVAEVQRIASDWLRRGRELALLAGSGEERSARLQLLTYQLEELDVLALGDDEIAQLEQEQKMLANAETILTSASEALELTEHHADSAYRTLQLLEAGTHEGKAVANARELLDSAAIQLTEARGEIQAHIDSVAIDPERLQAVTARLDAIYAVARKHRVRPEQLSDVHRSLAEELSELESGGERVEALTAEMQTLAGDYGDKAAKLTHQRRAAAKKLVKQAGKQLSGLSMEQCVLDIQLLPSESDDPRPHGAEDIEFRISTNPGAAPQPLGKIASGGELSRISLAIQVVTASTATVPSMVFDEVDVGIGGAVAEVVGTLLRQLAKDAQVLCVTHLPQVAAQGQQHLQVSKSSAADHVETALQRLDDDGKVQEIARMLGGVKITDQTLAHAREMLEKS